MRCRLLSQTGLDFVFSSNHTLDIGENMIVINNNNSDYLNNQVNIHKLTRVLVKNDVPAVKYLGIFIDPMFNFNYHAGIICNKISSALYFLRNAKNTLDQRALTSVYYALIHSHLIYGIQIWSICSKTLIGKLFKLQKQAIRIIHDLKYNAHTEPFFKKSKILPLPNLIHFFKLQFMQHFTQGFLPSSFAGTWTFNHNRLLDHSYNLRNSDDIYVPYARLTSVLNHPLHAVPKAWCEFHEPVIKIQREKPLFNKMLKQYLIDKLSDTVHCNRLFCPSCALQILPQPMLGPNLYS